MATQKTISALTELEQEAHDFMEGGQHLSYLSRQLDAYIMLKKNSEDLMKVAYICPSCGFSEAYERELKKPYTVTCAKCETLIFKQEKVKKGRGRIRK